MELEYTGQLWSRPVLGRILADEVRRGVRALGELVAAGEPASGTAPGQTPDPAAERDVADVQAGEGVAAAPDPAISERATSDQATRR
jgi:hypothetical protein